MNANIYVKPKIPEELYRFFTAGIKLKPLGHCYRFDYRRKGWNVFATSYQNGKGIKLEFYSYIKEYRPDWILKEHEYIETGKS